MRLYWVVFGAMVLCNSCKKAPIPLYYLEPLDNRVMDCFYFQEGSWWVYQDQFGDWDTVVYTNTSFWRDTIYDRSSNANYVTENFNIDWDRSSDERINYYSYSSRYSHKVGTDNDRQKDMFFLTSGVAGGANPTHTIFGHPMQLGDSNGAQTNLNSFYVYDSLFTSKWINGKEYFDVQGFSLNRGKIYPGNYYYEVSPDIGIVAYKIEDSYYQLVYANVIR